MTRADQRLSSERREMAPGRPAVLLLGTGHWRNPGLDLVNVQYGDVLAPARQDEIASICERLMRFAPTKIALEVLTGQAEELNREYRHYRSGTFSLTASEQHQLGFRIAARLGHERVYAIDWNEPIGDLGEVVSFAEQHQPEIAAELAALSPSGDSFDGPLIDSLRCLNHPDALAKSHRVYLTLVRVGAGDRYVGIDWVKGWYQRNLIIFANLTRISTEIDDRVLVIYGAGHIPLISQFIRESARFRLEPVERYLEP